MKPLFITGPMMDLERFVSLLELWEETLSARRNKLEETIPVCKHYGDAYDAELPPLDKRADGERYLWLENDESPHWVRETQEPRYLTTEGYTRTYYRLVQAIGVLRSIRETTIRQAAYYTEADLYDGAAVTIDAVRQVQLALAVFGVDPCEMP